LVWRDEAAFIADSCQQQFTKPIAPPSFGPRLVEMSNLQDFTEFP
jgi:hypothetical protein